MHIDPQLIIDINSNPYIILQKLSIKEIAQIIKQANYAYHQDGKPLFSDEIYEIIREYLAKLVPDHPLVQTDIVGAAPGKNAKVKLPIWMGSMNKIKDDPKLIEDWKHKYSGNYVISDKLDGISCLFSTNGDSNITLYSRGNGIYGQNISHLVKYIRGLPKGLQDGKQLMIRGELILTKKDWDSIKTTSKNPRNTVAGLANSKKPDVDIAKLVWFVAYECIEPEDLDPEHSLIFLKNKGFNIVFYKTINDKQLNIDTLSNILQKRREESDYEIDGIIVNHNKLHTIIDNENPSYAFAFKSVLTLEKAEVIVKNVQWNISKNGLLKPVVIFDTVFIDGAHIHRASAHNGNYIFKNKIGPGSRIIIIRSGSVIPYILEVLTHSSNGEPSFPDSIEFPWKWNENKIELVLINPHAAKEYQLKQIENYIIVLGIKSIGPKLIRLFYDRGIDSIKKLMSITKIDLYKCTYSSKITMKIYNQLQNVYRTGKCVEFMAASNIFGAGFGKKRFQIVTETFPDILLNNPPSLKELLSTKGIGEKFARHFLEHLNDFFEFIEDVGLPCRTTIQTLEQTPEGFMVLLGKNIVFTGFRSKELEEFIIKRGGKVSSSVSSNTNIVIAKNITDDSIKSETAKELGIPIISLKDFIEETGFIEASKNEENVDEELEKLKLDLEDMPEDEYEDEEDETHDNSLNKTAECIRHTFNWSNMKRTHIFGKSMFDKNNVLESLHKSSPKLETLLKKIESLDKKDRDKYGKTFKHMIFSDVVKRGFGAKIIASALNSYGYNHAYDKDFVLDKSSLLKNKGNNFAILASTQIYTKPINNDFKHKLLTLFNSRPDNINGNLIRIIVLDSAYKEGIDLFDVKYVHLYEPLLNYADELQAIGRATRLCGQKGLSFDEKQGWKLHVFKYDHVLKESLAKKYGGQTSLELIYSQMNKNKNMLNLSREIETLCQDVAIDKYLTKTIHSFTHQIKRGGSCIDDQKNIEKTFPKLKWPQVYIENLCKQKPETVKKDLLEFTPSQQFIRQYFQPSNKQKGLFLYHSLGSGKSCTAISVASYSWEIDGYTILWVTRGTLRSDVYKNMFDMSCLERIRDYINDGNKLPEELAKKKKMLSKAWIPPVSYRQFNNALNRQNRLYDFLIKRNGFSDPFKKTLLIIDEAHLMLSPTMKEKEKPNIDLLKAWIRNSYNVSGKNSVRLLLMSATPIVDNPYNFVKLMNLTSEKDMPEDEQDFIKKYLNNELQFTENGKNLFKEQLSGRISYLNRTKDIRQFAQPILHTISVPISEPEDLNIFIKEINEYESMISSLKEIKLGDLKHKMTKDIETLFETPLSECEKIPKVVAKKLCISELKKEIRQEKSKVDEKARVIVDDAKNKSNKAKDNIKITKKKLKDTKRNDVSILTTMSKKCFLDKDEDE